MHLPGLARAVIRASIVKVTGILATEAQALRSKGRRVPRVSGAGPGVRAAAGARRRPLPSSDDRLSLSDPSTHTISVITRISASSPGPRATRRRALHEGA